MTLYQQRPVKQLRGKYNDPIPMYPNTLPFSASLQAQQKLMLQQSPQKPQGSLVSRIFDSVSSGSSYGGGSYGSIQVNIFQSQFRNPFSTTFFGQDFTVYIDGDLLLTAASVAGAAFFFAIYIAITAGRRRRRRESEGDATTTSWLKNAILDVTWTGSNDLSIWNESFPFFIYR